MLQSTDENTLKEHSVLTASMLFIYTYIEWNEWKYRYSQRKHFCSTKMIMSRVKHRYCQNTSGCIPTIEPNVAK